MVYRLIALILLALFTTIDSSACTIFYFTHDGKVYFCNNEDWSDPDTEIRFHPARRGEYAWVYFGFSNNWAQGGVNEKGLCWDWVAGARVDDWKPDKTKKTFKGNLSEEMVKKCASVDEAISFLKKYNEPSFSYARMMIADKHGNFAILGWKNGQLDIQRSNGALQAFGYKGQEVKECFNSDSANKNLSFISQVLDKAHQEGKYPTQYSNVISISDGKIYLFKSHDYGEYLEINYVEKLTHKRSKHKIADLFTDPKISSKIKLVKMKQ